MPHLPRALLALASHVPRTLRSLVLSYVPCPLRTLLPHVHHVLHVLMLTIMTLPKCNSDIFIVTISIHYIS